MATQKQINETIKFLREVLAECEMNLREPKGDGLHIEYSYNYGMLSQAVKLTIDKFDPEK